MRLNIFFICSLFLSPIIYGSCTNKTSSAESFIKSREITAKHLDRIPKDTINGNVWFGRLPDQYLSNIKESPLYKEFNSNLSMKFSSSSVRNKFTLIGLANYIEYCRAMGVFTGDSVYCFDDRYAKPVLTVNPPGEGPTENLDEQNAEIDKYLERTKSTYITEEDITSKDAYRIFSAGGVVYVGLDIDAKYQLKLSFSNSYKFPQFKSFKEKYPYSFCRMTFMFNYSGKWKLSDVTTTLLKYNQPK